jgi:hypothetical protein
MARKKYADSLERKPMTPRKRSLRKEPLLNNVARKLGHAAGTLTKVTQELTENLSSLPETVTMKVREATNFDNQAGKSQSHAGHSRKRTAPQSKKAKSAVVAKKRRATKINRGRREPPTASGVKK